MYEWVGVISYTPEGPCGESVIRPFCIHTYIIQDPKSCILYTNRYLYIFIVLYYNIIFIYKYIYASYAYGLCTILICTRFTCLTCTGYAAKCSPEFWSSPKICFYTIKVHIDDVLYSFVVSWFKKFHHTLATHVSRWFFALCGSPEA